MRATARDWWNAGERRLPRAFVAVFAGLAASCFGEDAEVQPFEADVDALVEGWAEGLCERNERCYALEFQLAVVDVGIDFRPSQCVETTVPGMQASLIPALRDGIAAGRITYHPDQLEACLRADAARGCGDSWASPEACLALFEGQVPVGAPCVTHFDCQGDGYCDGAQRTASSPLECPWLCRERAQEGASCKDTMQCERGLRCYDPNFVPGTTKNRVCLPPLGEGEGCYGHHCEEGLVCGPDTDIGSPVCLDVVGGIAGDSCELSLPCETGLACAGDPSVGEGVCGSGTLGNDCTRQSECDPDQFCGCADLDCSQLVCTLWRMEGESCGAMASGLCAGGLWCNAEGRCETGREVGQRCDEDAQCYTANCSDGTCAPLGCGG